MDKGFSQVWAIDYRVDVAYCITIWVDFGVKKCPFNLAGVEKSPGRGP